MLGYALWLRGDWDRAAVTIALAAEARFEARHPIVAAVTPLQAITNGDYDEARSQLSTARQSLSQAPWPPAIQVVATISALLARIDPGPDDPARILPLLQGEIGEAVTSVRGAVSPMWILHLTLLHVWAGDTAAARTLIAPLDVPHHVLPWLEPAAAWLKGLLAERTSPTEARRLLAAANASGLPGLPLHSAVISEDLARLDQALGHQATATAAATAAATRFAALGIHRDRQQPTPGPLNGLTSRERDVVALLTEGAQLRPNRRGTVRDPQHRRLPSLELIRQDRHKQPTRLGPTLPSVKGVLTSREVGRHSLNCWTGERGGAVLVSGDVGRA